MSEAVARRLGNPTWVKGGPSPNPKGRRREDITVEALAKSYSCDAVRRLALLGGIYRDANGRLLPGARSETTQVHALNSLLNRALGLPRQELGVEGDSASLVLLHLSAAQTVSDELEAALERRTINARAEPVAEPSIIDLNAPPPTE